jgi:excisionase family DNA binding protein
MQASVEETTARKLDARIADVTPRVVNIEQAGVLLGGLSRAHLYRLIARGELRTLQSGSRRLVSLTAIDEYLARSNG